MVSKILKENDFNGKTYFQYKESIRKVSKWCLTPFGKEYFQYKESLKSIKMLPDSLFTIKKAPL
jgi:hypothetical protein